MKRISLLATVASMLAAAMALSGVAQAAQGGNKANAQCKAEAVRTLQPGFNPSDYNFIGGTEGIDTFDGQATEGADVLCGFGGNDFLIRNLDEGDIFLGGAGNDRIHKENNGTFYGGAGDEEVATNFGTVYGGAGDDFVTSNQGTFNGEEGNDRVAANEGTFNGGAGDDRVGQNFATFDGGDGNDSVINFNGGILINVESFPPNP